MLASWYVNGRPRIVPAAGRSGTSGGPGTLSSVATSALPSTLPAASRRRYPVVLGYPVRIEWFRPAAI